MSSILSLTLYTVEPRLTWVIEGRRTTVKPLKKEAKMHNLVEETFINNCNRPFLF